MLTKIISDNKRRDKCKVTISSNSAPNKKKKLQTNRKKKKSNSLSPTTQVTYNSCGHRIVRKIAVPEEIKRLRKRSKKKIMTDKYTSCVQWPNFEVNSLKSSNEGKESTKSKNQNTLSQQSFGVRELKKRKDISRCELKSAECSPCCKNSENFHYAVNYKPSRNMNSYSNCFTKSKTKTNNMDLNYNDLKQKNDQQYRYRTKYVNCPYSSKTVEKFYSSEEKNPRKIDNFPTIERIVCTNKNLDLYQEESHPEKYENLNKLFGGRSRDDSPMKYDKEIFPDSYENYNKNTKENVNENTNKNANENTNKNYDDQRMVKSSQRLETKFIENCEFDAYSPFKISIQCYERSQNKQRVMNDAANQETQTALEIKQQAISTDVATYSSKETQCEGILTQSRPTEIADGDLNINIPKTTVSVSCDQTDDYFLLMPGGKCVKLAQEIFTDENFSPCPGANPNYEDESFSICTEGSVTTQESNLVDSNTMTTNPELLERDGLRSESEETVTQEIFDSQTTMKTKSSERNDKKRRCRACRSNQVVDEDLKMCFEKLFNKKLSKSDCFPCLQEKLDKTDDTNKKFFYILKYALELSSKLENNNTTRFESKNEGKIIKKFCMCAKKMSDGEISKKTNSKTSNLESKDKSETSKTSKNITTEKEARIKITKPQNINPIQKNIGVEKQTETDKRPIVSRSMNTFVEEIPVEIIQTLLESEGTNTDYLTHSKETGTNTVEKTKSRHNAATQSRLTKKSLTKNTNRTKMTTTNQCREPILVRVISSSDRQKGKIQSQTSEYSTSESDDFRRKEFRRVCFNDNTQFQVFGKDLKNCQENCLVPIKDLSKIKKTDKNNLKIRKKLPDSKFVENQRVRNEENRKIFYSDFFD